MPIANPKFKKYQNKSMDPTICKTEFKAIILCEKKTGLYGLIDAYLLMVNSVGYDVAAFVAMLETRQIAKPENFIS